MELLSTMAWPRSPASRPAAATRSGEHPIQPRALAAPLHTHADEDEISYILEGEVGLQIGERVLRAGPGTLVFKPRGVPHAFWNRTDAPARLLEIIAPAAFAQYFRDIAPLLNSMPPDFEALRAVMARYGLAMDMDSMGPLIEAHGLNPPPASP